MKGGMDCLYTPGTLASLDDRTRACMREGGSKRLGCHVPRYPAMAVLGRVEPGWAETTGMKESRIVPAAFETTPRMPWSAATTRGGWLHMPPLINNRFWRYGAASNNSATSWRPVTSSRSGCHTINHVMRPPESNTIRPAPSSSISVMAARWNLQRPVAVETAPRDVTGATATLVPPGGRPVEEAVRPGHMPTSAPGRVAYETAGLDPGCSSRLGNFTRGEDVSSPAQTSYD